MDSNFLLLLDRIYWINRIFFRNHFPDESDPAQSATRNNGFTIDTSMIILRLFI